jgi:hypothetical protein
MQRRRYGSDKAADPAQTSQPSPEIEKVEPVAAKPEQPQCEPQAERSALVAALKAAQEADAKAAEYQQAQEAYRRAQLAHELQQRAQLPLEERLALLPDLTEAKRQFIRAYPEMIDDPANGALHFQALDRGHADDSDSYFAFIEAGLKAKNERPKPTAPMIEPKPPQPRVVVAAPVSREAISITSGQPVTSKITLTPEQREAAKFSMPGIPAAEAERRYAANLIRLEQARRAGLLQNGDGR